MVFKSCVQLSVLLPALLFFFCTAGSEYNLPGPSAPQLLAPANGAAGQTTAAVLSWEAVPGAASYSLQISTGATFATIVKSQTGLTASFASISELSNSTTYYWEVRSVNEDGSSAWSGTWDFSTASLATPVLISPTNGAPGQPTAPGLSWEVVAGAASYGVQVSTLSTFASTVSGQAGLTAASASLSGLATGTTYYWRANSTNADSTGTWSNAWHFTTLAAPVLSTPINGAPGTTTSLFLNWGAVTGAASYGIQISTVATFATTVLNQTNLTATLASVNGLAGTTTYYWKVSATGADGAIAWSGKWDFTTLATMVQIPGGTFQMGSTDMNFSDEQPVHSVTISPFLMDVTDVMQADYQTLMGVNPSYFTGVPQRPVEQVTWFDAVLYCNARSRHDGYDTVYSYSSITGTPGNGCSNLGNLTMDFTQHGYRLPTEAEWEYACRAGTTTDFYWGASYPPLTASDTAAIDANAVWWHNSPDSTQPVAGKLANAWGLYDMAGNVWQWCNDWYGGYGSSSQSDPTGPSSGTYRVMRGGSWANYDYNLRSADRYVSGYAVPGGWNGDNGFRCVRR